MEPVGVTFQLKRYTRSGCWEDAPPLPPIIRGALNADPAFGLTSLVFGLGSTPVSAGFEQAANLTGTWVGDDGGSYYLRHIEENDDVVWYAESPTEAVPGLDRH